MFTYATILIKSHNVNLIQSSKSHEDFFMWNAK